MAKLPLYFEKYLYDNIRDFSIETCIDRAIPSVVDGLKSAQRKAISVLETKRDFIKTISAAGEMISANIYLHGDASAAGVLSYMSCPYSNNYCYLQGKGTFGTKIYPTEYASPRYTYVKPSIFTKTVLLKDRDIIPTKDNYDNSVKEPKYYLPLIPIVLLNGISGLGVGWNTNILPHNLYDIINYCINIVKNKKVDDNLIPMYLSYKDIDIKYLGDSKYLFTSRVIQCSETIFKIQEIVPSIPLEKIIETLEYLKEKDIISSYEDCSKSIIDITINFKKGSKYVVDDVVNLCKLSTTDIERLVVIDFDNNSIRQYNNHRELVSNFIDFRLKWYYTRYNKLIKEAQEKIEYYKLFSYLVQQNASSYLKDTNNKNDLIEFCYTLSKPAGIADSKRKKIIQNIIDLPVYKWTKEENQIRLNIIKKLEEDILYYKSIISTPENIKKQYIKELEELKKLKF